MNFAESGAEVGFSSAITRGMLSRVKNLGLDGP